MSATLETKQNPYQAPVEEGDAGGEWQPYRAVNRSAVLSAALGALSFLVLPFSTLIVFLPPGAVLLGFVGRAAIKRYPAEYTGMRLANAGIALGVLLFFGGIALHTTIYLTEVPEGYDRITFPDLQPDPLNKREFVPKKAIKMHNKPVFVKGYVHPGVQGAGKVSHFILVPDMGTCCFGGQPKMTDMIEIHAKEGAGVKWSPSMIKLWGEFHLTPPRTAAGLNNVVYELAADGIK